MISQTIATDKRLNSLSETAELLYLKAIPHLDRDGLILGDSQVLWARVCPRRAALLDKVDDIIAEWIASGLVLRYESEDGDVLFFLGFGKNQTGMRYDREAPSALPVPPGYVRTNAGLVPQIKTPPPASAAPIPEPCEPTPPNSGACPELVRTSSGQAPSEVKLREGEYAAERRRSSSPTRAEVTVKQAARLSPRDYGGIEPHLLTTLTDEVKRICGFGVLVDKPGDNAIEDRMRDEAYRLWQMGYGSVDDLRTLGNAWREYSSRFKDRRVYGDQLYELALTLASAPLQQPSPTLDFSLEEIL